MSALGKKQTSKRVRTMSALPPIADIKLVNVSAQQFRQLCDIRRDPSRLKLPTLE
jgi:hypothetical protein